MTNREIKSEDIENEEDEEEEMEILTKEEPVEKREENENEGSSSTGSPPKLTPEPQEMMTSSMVKNGEEETPSASPTPKRKYKEREKKTTREYRVKKNRLIDHNAPKRYKSPYVQFMMQRRASYRNQKMTQGEINVAIANAWQELSAEERKPFEILAAKDKEKSKKAWKAYEKTAEFAEFQKAKRNFAAKNGRKRKAKDSDDEEEQKEEDEEQNMDKPFPGNAQFCPMLNSRNSEGPSTSTNYEGPIFSQQFVNYNKARDSYRRQLQMERANLDYELETLHEHDLEFKIEEQEKQKKSLDSKLALMLKTMKETLGSVPSSNGHLESVESLTEWLKTVQVKPNVRKSIREAILSKKKC